MRSLREAIVWKGEIVGYIEDARTDNFDLYGEWKPRDSHVLQEFLESLRAGEQLIVQLGETSSAKAIFTIEFEPDKYIEMKIRPQIEK